MTVLAEHQFEILPTAEAANGFVFGIGAAVSLDDDGFSPDGTGWLTQDSVNTRRGVRGFGRDVRSAGTWAWSSHVDQEDVNTAVATLEDFADAWSPEEIMRDPGAVVGLRYRLAGRNRRVFGRPRRFIAPPTNRILNGYVPIDHDFELVSPYSYADIESSALIPYSSTIVGGGFVLPTTFPIQTQQSEGSGSAHITIGGTSRAYPIIRFNGPWTNPSMVTDDWTLSWSGSIAANDWVEIDTRPWVLTAKRKSGASAASGLDRRTFLEDYWFAPGERPQIVLDGTATAGSASALVRWRDTYKSY